MYVCMYVHLVLKVQCGHLGGSTAQKKMEYHIYVFISVLLITYILHVCFSSPDQAKETMALDRARIVSPICLEAEGEVSAIQLVAICSLAARRH